MSFTVLRRTLHFCLPPVQFVVTGGSSSRLKSFAELVSERLDLEYKDMSRTDRFSFFKVGPIICINVSHFFCHMCGRVVVVVVVVVALCAV